MKITKVFSGCCITPCTKINHINIIHLIFKEEAVVHKSLQIASLVQFFRLKHLAGSIWLRVRKVIIFICFLIQFIFLTFLHFFVDKYKLHILVLCFGQPNHTQFQYRQKSWWLSCFTGFTMGWIWTRISSSPEPGTDLTYRLFLSPVTSTKDLKMCLLKHANRVKKVRHRAMCLMFSMPDWGLLTMF